MKSDDEQLPEIEPEEVKVKEENDHSDAFLAAQDSFQGALQQIADHSNSETETEVDSSDEAPNSRRRRQTRRGKDGQAPVRSTYVMKLYDRSLDLSLFDDNTPLYPICRAWIANNTKKQKPEVLSKRRYSSPEPDSYWGGSNDKKYVTWLPPANKKFASRIPSPTNEQKVKDLEAIDLNYDGKELKTKDEILSDLLPRWQSIRRKWIHTAHENEESYSESKKILTDVYHKGQESMNED